MPLVLPPPGLQSLVHSIVQSKAAAHIYVYLLHRFARSSGLDLETAFQVSLKVSALFDTDLRNLPIQEALRSLFPKVIKE